MFRAMIAPGASTAEAIEPPVAKVVPVEHSLHGKTWTDDYAWMRDLDDPDTIGYLEAENSHTEASLRHTAELQETLYSEMVARIQETDVSAPITVDGWQYYHRTFAGKQYYSYCRCPEGVDVGTDEQVILDENAMAEGHDYFRLGAFEVSPDGKLLAYSTDTDGNEIYTLHIREIASGKELDAPIDRTYYGLAWTEDSAAVYYTTLDEALRPYRVWCHRLGTTGDDALIHDEQDQSYYVQVDKTRSRRFICIHSGNITTSEVTLLDAAEAGADAKVFHPRTAGLEYFVDHHVDHFVVRTNLDAPDFRVMIAPLTNTGVDAWTEVVAHRDGTKVDDALTFESHLALHERSNGLTYLRVFPVNTRSGGFDLGEGTLVEMPDEVYRVSPGNNPNFATSVLRYSYTSLIEPLSTYEYDMANSVSSLLKRTPVLGGFDPANYRTERRFATAADGTKIPISIVYRNGVQLDGNNPTLLYGYGSYGLSTDPTFAPSRISLLDRGFVFAIGHIRGGTELGEKWWHNGKLLHKRNTFTDFVACAEELIGAGYTSPERLAIQGGSAGGLLMGATVNLRPDLFRAVIAEVPFVDVINTILDPSLPLSVLEYDEWGNPNEQPYFDYMLSYSPYDNVSQQAYPNMLVIGGLNDPRVSYWEPAKWVARLRVCTTSSNPILLKTNMGAGHSGASGRYDYLRETAFKYAFLIDTLGVQSA
jgi:oligopeptidase B